MKSALLVLAAVSLAGQVRRIDPPAAAESGMPFLAVGPKGEVVLAWTDTLPDREHALRLSRWTGTWSKPETIAQGRNWFVNWADFGSITFLPGGAMLAHWLTRADGGGTYGYGIRVARRDAKRATWREVHGMSLDEKSDYAGFLTFAPYTGAAAYLAPPAAGAHSEEHVHRKTARFIQFREDGSAASDVVIDDDVCSCCQTAAGKIPGGWIAAYRDHMAGEIRDISIVRYADGKWSTPSTLHRDGWKINGCPTDGPSLVTHQNRVAVAWLTRAGGEAKVLMALSSDGGIHFGHTLRIDGGDPLGRPAALVLDDTSCLVTWLEKSTAGEVEILLRRVTFDGKAGPIMSVGKAPGGRGAGFPKLAGAGPDVLLAWRDARVRAALISKKNFTSEEKK